MKIRKFSTGFLCLMCASFSALAHAAPLAFDKDGRPVTDITLNGQHTYSFVVDTAAQMSMIGKTVVDDLELKADPSNTVQVHGAAGGFTALNRYAIQSLQMGGVTKTNLLLPLPMHGNVTDATGIAGVDIFGASGFEMNFKTKTITLGPSDLSTKINAVNVPIDLLYNIFIQAHIEINGVKMLALIDTGARKSVANMAALKALGLEEDDASLTKFTEKIGITDGTAIILEGFTGDMTLGTYTLSNVTPEFSELSVFRALQMSDEPGLILGMDILGRMNAIAIDYKAKILTIIP